jgi:hypothetical protein
MRNNKGNTPERYRTTVLTYLCTVSRKRGKAIHELPLPLLSEVGVAIEQLGKGCCSPEVLIPADLDSQASKKRIARLKRYIRRNRDLEAPTPKPRKKGRPKKEKSEFQGNDPMEETLVLLDVSLKPRFSI